MGLHKQLNLVRYAVSNVRVYKARTWSIIVFITVLIACLSAVDFIRVGLHEDIDNSLTLNPDVLVQGYNSGRITPINLSYQTTIKELSGVNQVQPRVWGYVSAENKLYTVMGIDPTTYPLDQTDLSLQAGKFLTDAPSTLDDINGTCIIGSGVAAKSRAQVGSILLLSDINGQEFTLQVIGIFSIPSKIYTHDLILTDINTSRAFFDLGPAWATDLTVWLTADSDPIQISRMISESIEDVKVLDKQTLSNLLHHSINTRAGIFTAIWTLVLLGSLLFAFTISSAVSGEHRKEIGLLKTVGFSTMDILEIRVLEFTLLGFIASTLGIFCAIIYDFYLGAPILADFMLGWSVLFPNFIIPLKISIDIILVAYGIGTIPLVIATVVPAWKHAITEPDEVLRGL